MKDPNVMKVDWMLDVLIDLTTFAKMNDLPVLAEQLDAISIVALAEIGNFQTSR